MVALSDGHPRNFNPSVGAKRAGDPEANVEVPTIGGPPEAEGRAEIPWTVKPRTAAADTKICISTFCPGAAVWRRRSAIVGMPGIRHPFPDIAVHVVKIECIWRKLSHWGRVNPLVTALGLAAAVCAIVGVLVT